VDRLIARGERNIVVMGDLNEGPAVLGQVPANLGPLFDPNGPLVEAYSLSAFDPGPRPGSFQRCAIRERLDCIFVSRDLSAKVVDGGLERRGLWGGPTNFNPPAQWEIYPDITEPSHAASDHAAISVDINI
jgi:endonuclease/exonuclease/phosphatase family metal-dependent hydrolase